MKPIQRDASGAGSCAAGIGLRPGGFLVLLLFLAWLISAPAVAAPLLGVYNIQKDKISVSGISSGGFMAVQMHVAFSQTFMGAGIIAGGPYDCADGDVLNATGRCMSDTQAILPSATHFRDLTIMEASAGRIDPVAHLSADRVWLFTGGKDHTVETRVMDRLYDYYRLFTDGSNVVYERNTLPDAQHAMITLDYGNACDYLGDPYINDCDYDAAGALLNHIYGTLTPPRPAYRTTLKPSISQRFPAPVIWGKRGMSTCRDNVRKTHPRASCTWLFTAAPRTRTVWRTASPSTAGTTPGLNPTASSSSTPRPARAL